MYFFFFLYCHVYTGCYFIPANRDIDIIIIIIIITTTAAGKYK